MTQQFSKSMLNRRILIVDDFRSMRQLTKSILSDAGFTKIVAANDGDKGWKTLQNAPFDLVVSDWNMPNMTGLDLLKAVRQDDALSDMLFLMVTAEQDSDSVKEAVQWSVNDYVAKPLQPATLLSKVHALLSRLE